MARRDRFAPTVRLNRGTPWFTIVIVTAILGCGVAALLTYYFEEKTERQPPVPVAPTVELTEDTTDAAAWGASWPIQYGAYRQPTSRSSTAWVGGSETEATAEVERAPWLTRVFAGYAFETDLRKQRGHAFLLGEPSDPTGKHVRPGACLHCHASIVPAYREAGAGDMMRGFETVNMMPTPDALALLKEQGVHPVSCVDCHDPNNMRLRVTRPGFIRGIGALAASSDPLPQFPSIERWRQGARDLPYDVNLDASHQELRSFVCGQCHVEYGLRGERHELIYPWQAGLKVEQIESVYDRDAWVDYRHKESTAPLLKAQHPQFELWSQGVHARAGVGCADCHMPFERVSTVSVSDHATRSPLSVVDRACQSCHHAPESELRGRVSLTQARTRALLERAGSALTALLDAAAEARSAGVPDVRLVPALELQRKAQWRLDFVAAENSLGFHAAQESARIVAEAIDYARQAQVLIERTQLDKQPRARTESP